MGDQAWVDRGVGDQLEDRVGDHVGDKVEACVRDNVGNLVGDSVTLSCDPTLR